MENLKKSSCLKLEGLGFWHWFLVLSNKVLWSSNMIFYMITELKQRVTCLHGSIQLTAWFPHKYPTSILTVNKFCASHCSKLMPASVAQLDAPSDWRPGGRGFNPRRGRQHSFVEIDHEIFSTVILSHPLIQEGQFSVSGERMCTILVNSVED